MKKVFASDFDGTLYFYKAEVKLPPENVAKVREYQEAGGLFGLCTGRQVGGLTPFIGGIMKPDFYITSTGANIVDGDFGGIYRRGIDRDVVDQICKVVNPTDPTEHRISIDINGVINVFAMFGDYVNAFRNVVEVDIAPKGCTKGKGVERLKKFYAEKYDGIKLYGIGDSMNDLPLLLASDVSYTFPYAPEEVQKAATKVVPTIVDALEDSMNDPI